MSIAEMESSIRQSQQGGKPSALTAGPQNQMQMEQAHSCSTCTDSRTDHGKSQITKAGAVTATYATIQDAIASPQEKLMYVACLYTTGQENTAGVQSDPRMEQVGSTEPQSDRRDYIAVIDLDPASDSYCRVIHRVYTGIGEELHHFGWNSCSSCHSKSTAVQPSSIDTQAGQTSAPAEHGCVRRYLLVPGLRSSNVWVMDTVPDPTRPRVVQVVKGSDIASQCDLSAPHTVHCLPSGQVMVSMLGNANGEGPGGFLLLEPNPAYSASAVQQQQQQQQGPMVKGGGDSSSVGPFRIAGRWERVGWSVTGLSGHQELVQPSHDALRAAGMRYNYDNWYQPRHNVMISSEWGDPRGKYGFYNGFSLEAPSSSPPAYGTKLHIWNWKQHTLEQSIDLPMPQGLVPLEVRFNHNPDSAHAFVGAALGSSLIHVYRSSGSDAGGIDDGQSGASDSGDQQQQKDEAMWKADVVACVPPEVHGPPAWPFPMPVPGLISDIVMSMDDRWLYASCWAHGDVRQYDITDPFKPVLRGRFYLGGIASRFGPGPLAELCDIQDQPSGDQADLQAQDVGPALAQMSIAAGAGIAPASASAQPPSSASASQQQQHQHASSTFQSGVTSITLNNGRSMPLLGGPQMLQLSLDGKRLYVTNSLFSAWDDQFYPKLREGGSFCLRLNVDVQKGGLDLDRSFGIDMSQEPGGPARAHEMRFPGGDCTSDIWV